MAWSKTLFRDFRGLKSLEKEKYTDPYMSEMIKDLTKFYINKNLKPLMRKGRNSIGSV